jgi:hypothetical protein
MRKVKESYAQNTVNLCAYRTNKFFIILNK